MSLRGRPVSAILLIAVGEVRLQQTYRARFGGPFAFRW